MKHCKKCKSIAIKTDLYCNKCGKKLTRKKKLEEHSAAPAEFVFFILDKIIPNFIGMAFKKNYCKKCKKKNRLGSSHCTKCGDKLDDDKDFDLKNKLSSPLVLTTIALLLLAGLTLPTKNVPYTIEESYIDKEQYFEEIDYEDIEEYTVQVPYTAEVPFTDKVAVREKQEYVEEECHDEELTYTTQIIKCVNGSGFATTGSVPGEAIIEVENTDVEGGQFKFEVGYIKKGVFSGTEVTKHIDPGTTQTFSTTFYDNNIDKCSFNDLDIPEKTVCENVKKERITTEYKDALGVKQVTKYRNETKQRTVMKRKNETKEREIEKTRNVTKQKEVNWLFGFDALVEFRQ